MQLYLILYIKICYDSENAVRFVIHFCVTCQKYIPHMQLYVTQTRLRLCRKKRIQIHISRKRKRTENCKSTNLHNLLYSGF